MFIFISFIFKILSSLILTYMLLIFDSLDSKEGDENKNLILFCLLLTSMLNFIYMLSFSDINFSLSLLATAILLFIFIFFNKGNVNRYFAVYTLSCFISFGYFVMTLIVFSLYLFLEKYSQRIENYFNPTFDDNYDLSKTNDYIDE